jgi:hypothetical protein
LPEAKYQVFFGVNKATFDATLAMLIRAYEEMRKKGGRKRKLTESDSGIGVIIVDATECETERPKKQRETYSGKQNAIR